MLRDTPLRSRHLAYAATVHREMPAASRPGAATGTIAATNVEYIPYGLPAAGHERAAGGAGSEPACELVAGYGEVEAEYASIRKGAGLLDSPHRGTLLVTGADRRAFLNRMLTQELKDLAPGTAKPAFWLNRKGRIEADLLAIELGDRVIMALDILQAAAAARSLSEFLFSEDV
jgi:glycine cleavage system aminomethyltransferase T